MSLLIGSIVGINKDVFIVSKVQIGAWNLINLRNGRRFSDNNFPIGISSYVVSNTSQREFIRINNIPSNSFKILSSSLESLLDSKKKSTKQSDESLYSEFVRLLTRRYASTTMSGSLGRTNMYLYFDIANTIDTSTFTHTLQGVGDISIRNSTISAGFYHIEIPFSRVGEILRGDYGPI